MAAKDEKLNHRQKMDRKTKFRCPQCKAIIIGENLYERYSGCYFCHTGKLDEITKD